MKKEIKKTDYIVFKVDPIDKVAIKNAAKEQRLSISGYLRNLIMKIIKK